MSKTILAIALATVILAPPLLVEAQQQKALWRRGSQDRKSSYSSAMKGVRDGLKEAGYVEGKNLILDAPAMDTVDELRPIAKAYIEKKFDVIVAMGATAPLIARELTQEIPIVFVGASNPLGSGLVKSVARPEANVTGVASATDVKMQGKRLEVLHEAVPTLRRVAVLYNARGENQAMLKASR